MVKESVGDCGWLMLQRGSRCYVELAVSTAGLVPDLAPFAQGLPSPFLWGGITSNKTMWGTVLPCSAGFGGAAIPVLRAVGSKYCDLTSPCHGSECPWLDLGLIPLIFSLFLVLLKHKYECLCLCYWSTLGLGRVPWPGRRCPLMMSLLH